MSKFDAALSLLEGAAFAIRGHAKNREKALKDCREIANACIVLEAASKVDKGLCLFVFDRTYPLELESFPMIHDLLASLPDEETK